MKLATTLLIAASLIAGTALANAQSASVNAPGQKMQAKGSVKGSPGASGYAPGHATTGSKTIDADVKVKAK